jgi:hypothetical protein
LWKTAVPNETPNVTFGTGNSPIPAEKPRANTTRRTSSRRLNPSVSTATNEDESLKPRNSKLKYLVRRVAENAGSRWTVGKAKVATTTGNNLKYPFLKQTRTGWVAGLLTGFTEGEAKTYAIEWNTKPKEVSHVDDEEMVILRRDFLGSDKRRLLDMLCVGTEVLVPREIKGQKRGAEMKYGTVMYYDLAIKGFKVLCRDGHEKWVDPEHLDELTGEMLEEDSETLRIAAAEAWHPGIMKKVQGYGRYCVRQFGPDGNACVSDNVAEKNCGDEGLLPRQESQYPANAPGKEHKPSAVDENVPLWVTGQMLCFLRVNEETTKPKKTHGILALDVRNDSEFGTCLMATNKYNTFSSQEIGDAAKRMELPSFAHGCPTSTLKLLLTKSYNDITARDMAITESEGAWLLSQAPSVKVHDEDSLKEQASMPTHKYTQNEKELRKRQFPCTFCNDHCGWCTSVWILLLSYPRRVCSSLPWNRGGIRTAPHLQGVQYQRSSSFECSRNKR